MQYLHSTILSRTLIEHIPVSYNIPSANLEVLIILKGTDHHLQDRLWEHTNIILLSMLDQPVGSTFVAHYLISLAKETSPLRYIVEHRNMSSTGLIVE